jgi:TetR/AcrR family transcriptional regulator, fatty acid metabolism regulator protein
MTAHSPPAPSRASARGPAGGDKRERILQAAERVFAERGFFHARVSEIAREAGVADGTIYLYFKNKDDLLISLFESRMERVTGELTLAVDRAPADPASRLAAFIDTYAALVVGNPPLAEVLTVELRQSAKFMKEYQNPRFGDFLKLLAGIVSEGQESGALDTTLPAPIVARAIFGMLDELALAWLLGRGEKFDMVRAAGGIASLVLKGLERRTS